MAIYNFFIFLMIGIIQIIMVYFINIKSGKGFIWTEGIASIVPIIGLLLYLKTQKKVLKNIFVSMMIITIPLYNGCSPIGNSSFYPNKIKYAKLSGNLNNIATNRDDVAAIVIDEKRNNWTKKPIHSNFWYSFPVRSINGFVTPNSSNISLLHWYQHFTNIIKEDSSKKFIIEDLTTLSRYRHRHHLMATYIVDGNPTKETQRYFDIIGVNYLVTKENQNLSDNGYRTVLNVDGVKILSRNRNFDPIRRIDNIEFIDDDLDRVRRLLSDINFDIKNAVVTDNKYISELNLINDLKVISYRFLGNGNILINTNGKQGIITTNIVYNQILEVNKSDSRNDIKIFKCNFAFMCLLVKNKVNSLAIQAKQLNYYDGLKYFYDRLNNL